MKVIYQWDPEEYRHNSDNQKRWGVELISKVSFGGDERVLDIGCGTGELTSLIALQVPRGGVVGADVSPEMVHAARKIFPQNYYPNLYFQIQDARKLDFHSEFDIVYSNSSLHWIIDHGPVMRGIAESLKPGGRVVLEVGGRGNGARAFDLANRLVTGRPWSPFFPGFVFPYGFYGREEYLVWLEKAGLRPQRVELIHKDMLLENAARLAAWIRTTWQAYTHCVPESLRETFIHDIVAHYLREYPPPADGSIRFDMVRLEVEAVKPGAP
jgi:trans-aconitate 2-methyltransferase